MKRILWTILVIFVMSISMYSLEVHVDEIKKVKKVRFVNYKGPHEKVDSVRDVRSIGFQLAKGIKKSRRNRFRYFNKYSIIRAISKKEPDKLSADIFSIDRGAQVTNIHFVRHIISAYLQGRYGYTNKNANTLALFITYYNAVYRNKIDYIASKYKSIVLKKVNKRNVGISTRYYKWAGRSKMLIPLTKGSIDPFTISDDKVKKEIRKDDGNIDERKDLVKIKEKEIEKEKKELEKLKKEISKGNAIDKKTLIRKKEKEISAKKKAIEKEKREIRNDEIKRDIRKKPKNAKKLLEEKAKDLDKREDRLRDKEHDKNIFGKNLYYLKINEYLKGGHYSNEMFVINAATSEIILRSQNKNICGKRYDIYSAGIVVITHRGGHESAHRLELLDRKTLKPLKTGESNVFWRSFVEIRGGHIYAINVEKNQYYLGKYDQDLKLVAKSNITISENTFLSFYEDLIYINGDNKKIIVLKKADLSKYAEIMP